MWQIFYSPFFVLFLSLRQSYSQRNFRTFFVTLVKYYCVVKKALFRKTNRSANAKKQLRQINGYSFVRFSVTRSGFFCLNMWETIYHPATFLKCSKQGEEQLSGHKISTSNPLKVSMKNNKHFLL